MNIRLADKLLLLRKHYNLSQKTIANKTSIPLNDYMSYENGSAVPSFNELKRIAKNYRIPVSQLLIIDEEVTLRKSSTKEEDLIKEIRKDKVKNYINANRKKIGLGLVGILIVLVMFMPLFKSEKAFVMTERKIADRFAASDTSIGLLKDSGFDGRGDNSNGQLDVHENLYKISMGATFTVGIDEKGNVYSYGLLDKIAEQLDKQNRIVEIKAGSGHILTLNDDGDVKCFGDNSYGQCSLDNNDKVKHIFATSRASILQYEDGSLAIYGEVVGSSRLRKVNDVVDIDSSDNNLVYLKKDGTVDYFSTNLDFSLVATWKDIVDVACGNDFIAGIKKDGKVVIAIDNYLIENETKNWKNIRYIAAGSDYLAAYDGSSIIGVGKNTYHQFDSSPSLRNTLPMVKDVIVKQDDTFLEISFSPIEHASAYLIMIDAGTGYSQKVFTNSLNVPLSIFTEEKTYLLHITALGEGDYSDSETLSLEFRYEKKKEEFTPKPSEDPIIEVPFSLLKVSGMSKTNFEAYLKGLGVSDEQLFGTASGNICNGNEVIIETVSGISDYESLTTKELKQRKISYSYCELKNEGSEDEKR